MILIDSSIWIGLFGASSSKLAKAMEQVVEDAATCGIVIQEVLQGIHPIRYVEGIHRSLLRHFYLETPLSVYEMGAEFSRHCRARGIQLSTVDALISAIAIHHRTSLWTLDRDFVRAARHIPLKLYQPD